MSHVTCSADCMTDEWVTQDAWCDGRQQSAETLMETGGTNDGVGADRVTCLGCGVAAVIDREIYESVDNGSRDG